MYIASWFLKNYLPEGVTNVLIKFYNTKYFMGNKECWQKLLKHAFTHTQIARIQTHTYTET